MATFIRVNQNGETIIHCLENFSKEIVVIGRDPDCDIIVKDPNASGHHGCFFMQNGCWNYQDLNSTNGSYINGYRVFANQINGRCILSFLPPNMNSYSSVEITTAGDSNYSSSKNDQYSQTYAESKENKSNKKDASKSKSKKKIIISVIAAALIVTAGVILFFVLRGKEDSKLYTADKNIEKAAEKEVRFNLSVRAGNYDEIDKYIDSIPKDLYESVIECMVKGNKGNTSDYMLYDEMTDYLASEIKGEAREDDYYFGDDPEAYMEVRKEREKAYNNARIYISDEYSIHEYIKDNTDDDYYGENESSSTREYINLLNQLDEEFDARVIDGYYTMRSGNEDYDYSDDFSIVLIKYNGYWTPLTTIVTGIIFADYSKKADDVTAAGTVLTGVQTAMADEDCYSEIAGISRNVDREVQVLSVKGGNKNTVDIEYAAGPNVEAELRSTLASGCPIKYTKNDAKYFNVFVNGEALSVYISPYYNGTDWQIWPDTDPEYR